MRILFLFTFQLFFAATLQLFFAGALHAQSRVMNDKGQYIILMPDGTSHLDTSGAAVATETAIAPVKKDTAKTVSAVLTSIETKIVDAKISEAVKKDTLKAAAIIPVKVAVTQISIDVPLPTVSTKLPTEKIEAAKKDTVAPSTAVVVANPTTSDAPPVKIEAPTASAMSDTPPANPSAFATPDDEYMKRIKDAASPATNKQDAAVGEIGRAHV